MKTWLNNRTRVASGAWTTVVLFAVIVPLPLPAQEPAVNHYVFFNRDRERITEPAFLNTSAVEGAQLKYTWRELEPEPGIYRLDLIENDLAILGRHGKKLWIQLQDVSFDTTIINVPQYLRDDPAFQNGANLQYGYPGDDESKARPEGWVARRWDPAVRNRFHKLLAALGGTFDGRITGINLPETAVGFGESGKLFPPGYSHEKYRDGTLENLRALKIAFPRSVALQYANFMPGEWLPGNDKGFLRSVFAFAEKIGAGAGGPDLLPHRRGQQLHSYPLIREMHGRMTTAIAVQWGNYDQQEPETGRKVTIPELLVFARDSLRVSYIFWGTQEPFYSERVLPLLRQFGTDARRE